MRYIVTYAVSGYAIAEVEASSQEEAEEKAEKLDIIKGTEELTEWSFEDVDAVEEDEFHKE